MNPHELMWDSCKRSVPDVSLIKEQEKNDHYSPRSCFPMSSTPPPIGQLAMSFKPPSPDLSCEIRTELNLIKSELINVIRQHECQCREDKNRREQAKSQELEILFSISQQLKDLKAELSEVKESVKKLEERPTLLEPEKRIETVNMGVQTCCPVAEHSTQTPSGPKMMPHHVKTDFNQYQPVVEFLPPSAPPITPKPPNLPQSEISMTANKILQKYLPDEPLPAPPQHTPHPRWRQTGHENLVFNMTNVSVAMHRPTRNEEMWQNPSPQRYDESWPYNPNMDNYRQPMEPLQRIPMNEYGEPEPEWWVNRSRPKPKLIDFSAIMNQPKLL